VSCPGDFVSGAPLPTARLTLDLADWLGLSRVDYCFHYHRDSSLVGWCIFGVLRFKNNLRAFSIFMATAFTIMVISLAPWAFRNFRTLGGGIWTRSDFGLELQISNNNRATADLEKNVRSPDWPDPFTQVKDREEVRQMGELAYQRAKKRDALLWIRYHPKRFTQLVVLRILLFWCPRMVRWWQSTAEALITILAIGGLLSLLKKHHPSSWMFLAALAFYPAVYSVVQVSPRYRCPIEPILLLLGCSFCLDLRTTLGSGNWRMPMIIGDRRNEQPSPSTTGT
jgi:hypothetical protein